MIRQAEPDLPAVPARPISYRLSVKKKGFFSIVAIGLSGLVISLILEVALRVYHGEMPQPESELLDRSFLAYDPLLGYVPRPGRYTGVDDAAVTVGADGLRLNGERGHPPGKPILAVGDSFTFGAEVLDEETWPAQLESLLGRPVLNGGVGGYGIDQAVLRAERLMQEHNPALLILAFVSGDVDRCELSFRQAWKPYFEVNDGRLESRNVPVPTQRRQVSALRNMAGHSYLARAALRRLAPEWWYLNTLQKEHDRGEEVVCLLLSRLVEEARQHGTRLMVVTLRGRRPDMSRLPPVVAHARKIGLQVLNLAPQIAQMAEDNANGDEEMFQARGHLSPTMNAWVAARIAELPNWSEQGANGDD